TYPPLRRHRWKKRFAITAEGCRCLLGETCDVSDDPATRVGRQCIRVTLHKVRLNQNVIIQEKQVIPACDGRPRITRRGGPGRVLMHESQRHRKVLTLHQRVRIVGAAIINDDHFPRLSELLSCQVRESQTQRLCAVMRGNNDAELCSGHLIVGQFFLCNKKLPMASQLSPDSFSTFKASSGWLTMG